MLTIKRVPAHSEFTFASFIDILHFRLFLRSSLTDNWGLLDGFPQKVVGDYLDDIAGEKLSNNQQ